MVIYDSCKDMNDLQNKLSVDLALIQEWSSNNFLELNQSKCKLMMVGKAAQDIDLRIKDYKLELVSEYKYLGVWLDNQLKYEKHVKSVVKKNNCGLIYLRKFSNCTYYIKKLIYNSFVLTNIDYCAALWSGRVSRNLQHKIEVIHNNGLEILTKSPFRTNVRTLLVQTGYLSIEQ